MALWLFRRKSRRKRARSSTLSGDEAQRPVPRSQTAPDATVTAAPTRQQSKRQRVSSGPQKLQRRARTYSFESGRRDSLHVGQKKPQRPSEPVPPLPNHDAASRPPGSGTDSDRHDGVDEYGFERVPTLHANKRDGQHLKQRSSKRRKNSHDREREAELKAMSNFVPVRPATDAWNAGRPMKKDTKRIRSGLGLGFGSGRLDRDRGSSDISLPTAESIHSSMSSDSDQVAYKISALDALAPKPTLRVASFPRWGLPSHGSVPQRTSSQRRRFSEKAPIPEATLKAHKRIHELADDLSASDLREVMERDQRRREKKRQKEQERVEKRLARRAEKQRMAGEEGAPNLERGVIGREVGLGIDPSSAVRTSSRRRQSTESQQQQETVGETVEPVPPVRPQAAFHRSSSIPLEVSTPAQEPEEPVSELPKSPKRRGFLRVKKSRDKSPVVPLEKRDTTDTPTKGSEAGSSRGPSWTSIFRWGNKKRTSGPSSFSNTSRDSMGTQTQPAAPVAPVAPPMAINPSRNMSAGVRRTLSRFREDLPDFLMSPPDSRAQSPEPDAVPATIDEQNSPPALAGPSSPGQARYDTPTSDRRSYDPDELGEEMGHTPSSKEHRAVGPSPEPQHSMSMASIDSEASWLSGRLGSRSRTSQRRHTQDSTSHPYSSAKHHHASADTVTSHEHDEVPEEAEGGEDSVIKHENRLSNVSDGENSPRFGAVGSGQPNVIAAHNVKSREGLLNMGEEDSEADLDSPISPNSADIKVEEAGLQRATSINLSQRHARHISAGSAKLLELSPRSSVDYKGRSPEPRT